MQAFNSLGSYAVGNGSQRGKNDTLLVLAAYSTAIMIQRLVQGEKHTTVYRVWSRFGESPTQWFAFCLILELFLLCRLLTPWA